MANQIDIRYIDFSTEGNAARKFAPAQKKKAQLPGVKRKKSRVLVIDPLALIGVAVAVCMIVFMGIGMFRLQAAQEKNVQMAQYVDSLNEKNTVLQAEFNEVCDLDEVRQLALALGMIPKLEAPQTGITMYVPEEPVATPSLWEQIGTFLAGLFA
ncbi:MAG: hypothetical protein IJD63_02400 [Oscillospiraceae bacterium]|nr:hypothetical protein [Oscillospiraceae bacterium]